MLHWCYMFYLFPFTMIFSAKHDARLSRRKCCCVCSLSRNAENFLRKSWQGEKSSFITMRVTSSLCFWLKIDANVENGGDFSTLCRLSVEIIPIAVRLRWTSVASAASSSLSSQIHVFFAIWWLFLRGAWDLIRWTKPLRNSGILSQLSSASQPLGSSFRMCLPSDWHWKVSLARVIAVCMASRFDLWRISWGATRWRH